MQNKKQFQIQWMCHPPLPGGDTAVYTSSGLAYYRHTDHLGSSRFASTSTRTLYADYAYAPFGEPYAQSSAIDPSFTGQNQDTTSGLYDFLYREHDPNQARWTSPDPAGLAAVDPSDPQTWNRFAYVANLPLDEIDPLGLCPGQPGCPPRHSGPLCEDPAARANGGCTPSIPCIINFIGCAPFPNDPNASSCSLDGADAACNTVYGLLGAGAATLCADPSCNGGATPGIYSLPGGGTLYVEGQCEGVAILGVSQGPPSCTITGVNVLGSPNGNYTASYSGGGSGQGPNIRSQPTLKFRPPSWSNFTNEFLPCYGAQIVGNFLTGNGLVGTTGAVVLTAVKPIIGAPVSAIWTVVNAFQAGAACALASRGYYQ